MENRASEVGPVYRIIKKRELWDKLTIWTGQWSLVITLTRKDKEEFEREWSKVKAVEVALFVGPLDVDWTEDDEGAIDMDKSSHRINPWLP